MNGDDYMMQTSRIAKANPYKRFNSKQKTALIRLQKIREDQKNGKNVDAQVIKITESLKQSGILDSNGELSKHYRNN